MFVTRLSRTLIVDPLRESLPLFRQVISPRKGQTPRQSLVLASALVVMTLLAVWWLSTNPLPDPDTRLLRWWLIVRYALFQVGSLWPYVTTLFTAWLVDRLVRQESFALLRQTAMSDQAVTAGYALSSLYRLRWLAILTACSTVVLIFQPSSVDQPSTEHLTRLSLISIYDAVEIGLTFVWQIGLAVLGASLITLFRLRLGRESQAVLMTGVAAAMVIALIQLISEWSQTPIQAELFYMAPLATPFIRMGIPVGWGVVMAAATLAAARLIWEIEWRTETASRRAALEVGLMGMLLVTIPLMDEQFLRFRRAYDWEVINLIEGDTESDSVKAQRACPGSNCAPRSTLAHLELNPNAYSSTPTELPPEIGQLTSLRSLDLGNIRLTGLPAEIGQLAHLESLNLSGNQLTDLPPEIGHLSRLRSLYLQNNRFSTLRPEIGRLASLEALDLSGNFLINLPPGVVQITNLKQLDLQRNRLRDLPPEIGQMVNLQTLLLSGNHLGSTPVELFQLPKLEILALSMNRLTEINISSTGVKSLRELYLNRNHLPALPPAIRELTSLTRLDVSYNQLTYLPPEIGKLTQLQWLDLSGNHLTSIPSEIGSLENLQGLALISNQLESLPAEIGQLTHLRHLNLSMNHLVGLPPEIGGLINLQALELSNNRLITLPAEISGLTKLQDLRLPYNRLKTLPTELGQLPALDGLSVYGNPSLVLSPGQCLMLDDFNLFELCPNP